MPKMSLVDNLQKDYPSIVFRRDDTFRWSPSESTVYYADPTDIYELLHETSHAILGHTTFHRDINLLTMEHEAWDHATQLAKHYGFSIPTEIMEDALDTYRDWLYARSSCPHCDMTGIQHRESEYRCPACLSVWRVNDARVCGLRRTIQKSPVL